MATNASVLHSSYPSANKHMRCFTTIFESVLVSIQLNHPVLVPMPSGLVTPCWFLHHPAQSPRVGSYAIRLSHPVLVPMPSGSVTPCWFLHHPAKSPRVGFYTIRLSHPVLVSTPSGSVTPCWFLHHLAQSPSVGSYAIQLNHPVLVSTPSGSVTPCWFLHHPAQSPCVGFYTIRLSHVVPRHVKRYTCIQATSRPRSEVITGIWFRSLYNVSSMSCPCPSIFSLLV